MSTETLQEIILAVYIIGVISTFLISIYAQRKIITDGTKGMLHVVFVSSALSVLSWFIFGSVVEHREFKG